MEKCCWTFLAILPFCCGPFACIYTFLVRLEMKHFPFLSFFVLYSTHHVKSAIKKNKNAVIEEIRDSQLSAFNILDWCVRFLADERVGCEIEQLKFIFHIALSVDLECLPGRTSSLAHLNHRSLRWVEILLLLLSHMIPCCSALHTVRSYINQFLTSRCQN